MRLFVVQLSKNGSLSALFGPSAGKTDLRGITEKRASRYVDTDLIAAACVACF